VPAYVIFHDATLREIARARPSSLEALRGIAGVGARKLEAYGTEIVALVR
jgi:ATP-dependent DNA helicase RecQ